MGSDSNPDREKCPRCGMPVSYYKKKWINGRLYLYAVHYFAETKERKECYLGPLDSYRVGILAPSQANLLRADYRLVFKETLESLLARARELSKQMKIAEPLEILESLLEEYKRHVKESLRDLGYDGDDK